YSRRYRSEEVVTLSYINYNSTIKSPRAHADASFFYDNGQKKFSYTIIDEEFVPDTLFYKNGNPKFVMLKDERTKEFVSEFFDVDGVKMNQERNDFEGKRIVGESYMMFKGLKLEGGKSHNIFKYEHTPSYEEIADSEDTLVYTYIEFENANLTHQIYYLPHQKVRVEKRDMDWESPYYNYITTEKRQYFNEDYTECRTEIVTTVGSKFKIFQEYDAVYSMSFYDAEEDGEKLDGMINKRSPIRNVRQGTTNYFSYYVSANTDNTRIAEVKISNLKTEYAYKNKPFEGKLKVDFDGGGRGLKINKRKILISSYSSSGFLDYDNMVLRDGFNASYHHNDLLLMPNLYSEIPSFNGSPFKEIKKVKGQFENGKFEGDFAYRNYRNKKIIETTYEQNKLTGQLTYYRFRKREKRTWNSNYVQKREYHKIQVVNFEDNQMKDALLLNLREDTLAYMTYENGLATKGVFYNKFRNMIVSDDADKETFLLEKGIPQSLHIEFKKGHEYTYLFQDGLLHGKHEFRLDSGSYNHGVFTGVFKQNKGHGIIHKEFVQDGLVLKELVLNSDDVLLSQIVYDTNEVKLNGSVYNTYQISPHVTFVQAQENITGSKIAAEGEFTSYYVNGEVHAEGILTENIMQPRGGQWKYYNPDGELMSKVSYQRSFEFFNNIEDLTTFGEIEIYNENKLVSKGAVIDLIEKYNCSDADSYEVRQLAILEDYVGGEVIKYPSRYHKTYYDMGVLQAEGELVKGVPSGIWKFYDRQGGLRSVGNYMSGKKEGRWLEGDLTGLGFIGDFCISPGSYEIRKEFLETNIELNIQMFEEGEMKSHRLFKAKVDK
ncbi:MAG: antitoxin component YwqK of YwqJK toxin-antitoxin module, partial [Arenicella sp.]